MTSNTKQIPAVKPLRWDDYCPGMPKLLTKDEIFRRQINKEDEYNHRDVPPLEIDNKALLKSIKAQRVRRYDPGIYNFCKYTLKSVLP